MNKIISGRHWVSMLIWILAAAINSCYAQPNTAPFYIILGESNCGWSVVRDIPADQQKIYKAVVPQTDIFNPGRGDYNARLEKMEAGVNTMCENYVDPNQFGAEVPLMKSLQNQKHVQRFVYKQGQANTSLVIDWKPVHPYSGGDGSRFSQLEQWLTMAAEQADKMGYKLALKGIIMIGGENDSRIGHEERAKMYLKGLQDFFKGFDVLWNDLVKKNKLPVTSYKKVICRVNAPGASFPFRDLVRKAQETYCGDKANNALMINMDAYPLLDYVHYSAAAQIQLGNDIFAAARFE